MGVEAGWYYASQVVKNVSLAAGFTLPSLYLMLYVSSHLPLTA
jgi:hypothetical protein